MDASLKHGFDVAYLGDSNRSPLCLPEQLQGALALVMVLFWDGLQHSLGQLDVSVFILVVGVSAING